jgi:hypothetical protein
LLPQLIQESPNVLLYLFAKGSDHRLVKREQIERIVPTTDICPTRRGLFVVHQSTSEILQLVVEVFRPIVAQIYPRGEHGHHGGIDHLCRR